MAFETLFPLGLVGVLVLSGVWLWLAMRYLPPFTKRWLERKIGKKIDERAHYRGRTWHIRGRVTGREMLLVYGVNLLMTLLIVLVPAGLLMLFMSLVMQTIE